jgi:hypothetical protein
MLSFRCLEVYPFIAESHMESIRIKYNDYVSLVKPVIVEFAVKLD